jgi:3-oxoacyl-[acyl-carrier protein] reductase
MNLTSRVAVVTGASRGIGRLAAIRLAEQRARVALVARSAEPLAATVELIRAGGGSAIPIAADVGDPVQVQRLRQEVLARLGPPAILVNAAGIFGPIARIQDTDPACWVETLRVNTIAPYLLCRAFLGEMMAQEWGRIVNVSSAAAFDPPGGLNSAYATSKVALNHFTRHLAAELAGTGVTANVIHPGDVKTEMWADIRDQVARMGPEVQGYRDWVNMVAETGGDPPEKAAELILRLMGDHAAEITGQFLWIEDGLRAPLPSW